MNEALNLYFLIPFFIVLLWLTVSSRHITLNLMTGLICLFASQKAHGLVAWLSFVMLLFFVWIEKYNTKFEILKTKQKTFQSRYFLVIRELTCLGLAIAGALVLYPHTKIFQGLDFELPSELQTQIQAFGLILISFLGIIVCVGLSCFKGGRR